MYMCGQEITDASRKYICARQPPHHGPITEARRTRGAARGPVVNEISHDLACTARRQLTPALPLQTGSGLFLNSAIAALRRRPHNRDSKVRVHDVHLPANALRIRLRPAAPRPATPGSMRQASPAHHSRGMHMPCASCTATRNRKSASCKLQLRSTLVRCGPHIIAPCLLRLTTGAVVQARLSVRVTSLHEFM